MILGEDAFGSERRGDRYLPEFSELLKRLRRVSVLDSGTGQDHDLCGRLLAGRANKMPE